MTELAKSKPLKSLRMVVGLTNMKRKGFGINLKHSAIPLQPTTKKRTFALSTHALLPNPPMQVAVTQFDS